LLIQAGLHAAALLFVLPPVLVLPAIRPLFPAGSFLLMVVLLNVGTVFFGLAGVLAARWPFTWTLIPTIVFTGYAFAGLLARQFLAVSPWVLGAILGWCLMPAAASLQRRIDDAAHPELQTLLRSRQRRLEAAGLPSRRRAPPGVRPWQSLGARVAYGGVVTLAGLVLPYALPHDVLLGKFLTKEALDRDFLAASGMRPPGGEDPGAGPPAPTVDPPSPGDTASPDPPPTDPPLPDVPAPRTATEGSGRFLAAWNGPRRDLLAIAALYRSEDREDAAEALREELLACGWDPSRPRLSEASDWKTPQGGHKFEYGAAPGHTVLCEWHESGGAWYLESVTVRR
jgi:hypothetical protein